MESRMLDDDSYLPRNLKSQFSHDYTQFHTAYSHYFTSTPAANLHTMRGVVMDAAIAFEVPSLGFLRGYLDVKAMQRRGGVLHDEEPAVGGGDSEHDVISIPDEEYEVPQDESVEEPSPSLPIMQQCAHLYVTKQYDALVTFMTQENLLHPTATPITDTQHLHQLYILCVCCHLHYCGANLWKAPPNHSAVMALMQTLSQWKHHLPRDLLPIYWLVDIHERRGELDEALHELMWIYVGLKVVNRYVCVKLIWFLEVMMEREKRIEVGEASDTRPSIPNPTESLTQFYTETDPKKRRAILQETLQDFYQELILLNFKNGAFLNRREERINIMHRIVFDTASYPEPNSPDMTTNFTSTPTHPITRLLIFYSSTLLTRFRTEFRLHVEYIELIQKVQYTIAHQCPGVHASPSDTTHLHTEIVNSYFRLLHAAGKKSAYEDLVHLLRYTQGEAPEDTPTVNQDPTQVTSALSQNTMHVHSMFVQLYAYLYALCEHGAEYYEAFCRTYNSQENVKYFLPSSAEAILNEWRLALQLHGEYSKADGLDKRGVQKHLERTLNSGGNVSGGESARSTISGGEHKDHLPNPTTPRPRPSTTSSYSHISLDSVLSSDTQLMNIPYVTNTFMPTTHSTYIASGMYHDLAQILVLRGQINDAISVYALMVQSVPLQFNLHLMDFVRLLEEDTREEELILFYKSLMNAPESALPEDMRISFGYSLALLLDAIKEFDEALLLYEKVSERYPHHPVYGAAYADALIRRRRYEEAKSVLLERVKQCKGAERISFLRKLQGLLQAHFAHDMESLVNVTKMLKESNPKDADYSFAHGEALMDAGDTENGMYFMERAVRLDVERSDRGNKKGKRKGHKKGQPKSQSTPNPNTNTNFYTRSSLAFYLKHRQAYPESITLFKKLIRESPETRENYANLANLFLECGRVDEGLQVYRILKMMDPTDIETRLMYANFLKVYKRYSKALKEYEAVLQMDPDNIRALQQCASLFYTLRDAQREHETWMRLLQGDPNNKLALIAVAKQHIYGKHVDPLAALPLLERAVQLYPQSHQAHKHLGVCYNMVSRNRDAVASIQCSISLKPGYGAAHYALGLIFKEEERVEDAEKAFLSAIDLGYKKGVCVGLLEEIGRGVEEG